MRASSGRPQAQLTLTKIKQDLPFPPPPPTKIRALPLILRVEASEKAQPHLELEASPTFLSRPGFRRGGAVG